RAAAPAATAAAAAGDRPRGGRELPRPGLRPRPGRAADPRRGGDARPPHRRVGHRRGGEPPRPPRRAGDGGVGRRDRRGRRRGPAMNDASGRTDAALAEIVRWPAARFYWAVLEAPGWTRSGPLPEGLRPELEELAPEPLDSLHAV